MLVNIVRWCIPKEYSGRQLEVWREMMDWQRAHPEKVFYTRSRFFTSPKEGQAEESWMFLDEYERPEDYEKWMRTVREDPELIRLMEPFFSQWDALIVPGSKKGGLDRGREPPGRAVTATSLGVLRGAGRGSPLRGWRPAAGCRRRRSPDRPGGMLTRLRGRRRG